MSARVCQIIVSDDATRGEGVQSDPVRTLLRAYTVDGELLIEAEPTDRVYVGLSSLLSGVPGAYPVTWEVRP